MHLSAFVSEELRSVGRGRVDRDLKLSQSLLLLQE
jgi:hypothetical protein